MQFILTRLLGLMDFVFTNGLECTASIFMVFPVQPLCGTEPMLVLEFSMLVLESCPTQTIELFLSGNIPADLVNSYLKQHAPSMQGRYLELMLAMNENGISGNLQNEMVNNSFFQQFHWHFFSLF